MCNSLAHHCRHMSDPSAFYRILQSLHDAMLDDAHWPAASALIDELCGLTGNALAVGEGPKADIRVSFFGYITAAASARTDLEREYLENYHPIDERVPRLRQLPDSLSGAGTQEYVYGRGTENLSHLQRDIIPEQPPEWLERAPGHAGWLPRILGDGRSL